DAGVVPGESKDLKLTVSDTTGAENVNVGSVDGLGVGGSVLKVISCTAQFVQFVALVSQPSYWPAPVDTFVNATSASRFGSTNRPRATAALLKIFSSPCGKGNGFGACETFGESVGTM